MASKIICPKCKIQIGADYLSNGMIDECPFCSSAVGEAEMPRKDPILPRDAETVDITEPDQTIDTGTNDRNGNLKLVAGDVIGGFTLERRIGRGGMGEVWLAEQSSMRRKVALKIMYSQFSNNSSFLYRFNKEVKIIANLDHPNIVTAHDAGEDNGTYYLAMKYVDGASISGLLKENTRFLEHDALTVIRDVAAALKYAWDELQLLHRDIKPGNIMIGSNGKPQVMDMGISRSAIDDNSLTITGMTIGTPYYMSPEQADGLSDIDCRADIYSLGITLYHMVTGEVPYDGSTTASVIKKHVTQPFPPPQEKNPELSDACALLLETMMAKQRENRYQNWDDVVADFDRVIAGELPSVKPIEPRNAAETDNDIRFNNASPHYSDPAYDATQPAPKRSSLWILFVILAFGGAFLLILAVGVVFYFTPGGMSSKQSENVTIETEIVRRSPILHERNTYNDELKTTPEAVAEVTAEFFERKKLTLAVLPFENQTSDSSLDGPAKSCSDALIRPLSKIEKINLVERMQLDKVVKEIDLSQTAYVDPEYAIKIGKLLGVDAAILGALQKMGDKIRITVKVVSSETGKIIYTEHVDGDFDDFFDVQDELGESLAAKFK